MYDWNQVKEKKVRIKKANSKIGSILRALKGEFAERYFFKDFKAIQKVAVVGTKLL